MVFEAVRVAQAAALPPFILPALVACCPPMQFVRDIYAARQAAGKPVISFEFFPPKTEEGDRALLEKTIPALMQLKPDFCSVTYGAGGGTREKTLMIVDRIQREHRLTTVLHLTCVNATKEQVGEVIAQARALGVKNILALRGDPPGGNGVFTKTEGGFEFSYQLVAYIRQTRRLLHRHRRVS